MKKYTYLVIVFLLSLVSCNIKESQNNEPPQSTHPTNATIATRIDATSTVLHTTSIPIATDIPSITNAATVAPILLTPSPWPTMTFVVTPNANQLARWQEYEKALAIEFIPSPKAENILCEWIILGQLEQEVYVWAFCKVAGRIPTSVSAPAVIYLETDGAVKDAEHPGSGSLYPIDVNRLFPPNLQGKIYSRQEWLDVGSLEAHIHFRLEYPEEPPLCILSAISTP